jgi:hypothetical protein
MLLQLIAVLQCSITQGGKHVCKFFSIPALGFHLTCILFAGLVHLSLLYLYPNTLKQYFTHAFQLECASGCFLRLKNQVSVGIIVVDRLVLFIFYRQGLSTHIIGYIL